MSVILDIADAVVGSLAGGTFSQSFIPERRYAPVFDASRGQLNSVKVSVIPVSATYLRANRGEDFTQVAVSIIAEWKVSTDDQTDLDSMMELVEEIRDHLQRNVLPSAPSAKWLTHTVDPVFDPDQLTTKGVFSSVQTVTYQV